MTSKSPIVRRANTPAQTDEQVLAELSSLGFSDNYIETPRRLIVSSEGMEKTGKTSFALSAPDPIIYIDIDIGGEGVIGKFQETGKKIYVYSVLVPKQAKQDVYEIMWADLKTRIEKAYLLSSGTVVWDTATEAFELCRLARFGRLTQVQPHNYTETNNEWREIVRKAFASRMNTVYIHKRKPVWLNTTDSNGKLKSIKTKDMELSGFAEMGYLAQVNLIHMREDTDDAVTFSVYIKECRHRAGVAKQTIRGLPLARGDDRVGDPLCNFEMLLSLVHGDKE